MEQFTKHATNSQTESPRRFSTALLVDEQHVGRDDDGKGNGLRLANIEREHQGRWWTWRFFHNDPAFLLCRGEVGFCTYMAQRGQLRCNSRRNPHFSVTTFQKVQSADNRKIAKRRSITDDAHARHPP